MDLTKIIDAFNYLSLLPCSSKLIAGDFNAPSICWNTVSTPNNLLDFMSCIRVGRWIQHVTVPTRGNNILDLLFTIGLSDVSASTLDLFPGSDHKMVSCTFVVPQSFDKSHPPNHFSSAVNWVNLICTLRSLDWDDFFLQSDPQLAADLLYSNLSYLLSKITTTRITSNRVRSSILSRMQCI